MKDLAMFGNTSTDTDATSRKFFPATKSSSGKSVLNFDTFCACAQKVQYKGWR